MRVLITTDTVGGVWTYSRELTQGLLGQGCKVTLVSMGRRPSPSQSRWSAATADLWPGAFSYIPTDFKLEWMRDGTQCYEDSEEFLLSCVAASGAEILHSNQFCYGALPVDIPKVVVAHSDVLSWSMACHGRFPERSRWSEAYRKLVLAGLEGADIVVSPTDWMRRQIERYYRPSSRSMVISNGRSLMAPSRLRKLQAITCGRLWDEAKNIRLLQGLDLTIPLLLAGDAEFEQQVCDNVAKLTVLGTLTEAELLQRLSESAIYIAASRYEPFGLAPLEAALCGCAIVANDIPSFREVWGDAAVYFERNNGASLSSVMADLSRKPRKLQEAAQAAYSHAAEKYSGEHMVERYLRLYRALVDRDVKYVA